MLRSVRSHTVLTSMWRVLAVAAALLVAGVLLAAPGVAGAQGGMNAVATSYEERATAEAERRHRARAEQRRRLASAAAHARMPSTLYASTPDPAPPPHPAHSATRDGRAKGALARSAAKTAKAAPESAATGRAPGVPLLVAASDPRRQGLLRLINHSDTAGTVRIDAWDDAGERHGPVTLRLGAGEATHFTSTDLERGNAAAGLEGALGPPGEGHWRLALTSALAIEALAYLRTGEGFLSSLHDVVAPTEGGHHVALFQPGGSGDQGSRLRLVNPGTTSAEVTIEGIDDEGASSGGAVRLALAPGAARTLTASQLESGEGEGLSDALGEGTGRWRLVVNATRPIEVMSLYASPTGHLSNLSSAPQPATGDATATHTVAFLPAAARGRREGVQGLVRLINRSGTAGTARIEAFDDAGQRHGPLTLRLVAGETVRLSSADLERGNAAVGLDGTLGPPGAGDWRLRVRSRLDLEVLAYARAHDGFLSSLHDVVAKRAGAYPVALFPPGGSAGWGARLRLVNPGTARAEVTIEGVDDEGRSPGTAVRLALAAGAARTLTAQQLESGDAAGSSGALGDGTGHWRLRVTANQPLEVMSLLASPTGYWANLSTSPGAMTGTGPGPDPAPNPQDAEAVFRERISGPVVQAKCVACHVQGGVSGNTRLVFVRATTPDHEARNLRVFEDFLTEVDDGASVVLNKIQGVAHGGGVQVPVGSPEFAHMERFLRLLGEAVSTLTLTPQTLFDTVRMAPWRKTLRRAAIIFAGRNPTEAEYAAVAEGGWGALRTTIRGLMTGPQFHEFLTRAANDRLLTDTPGVNVIESDSFVAFTNEAYRLKAAEHASGAGRDRFTAEKWLNGVVYGTSRAPLELIAHVVENDLPYTEILAADYIMANPPTAAAYGASTKFDDPEDPHEFKPSRIVSYYRKDDEFETELNPVINANRVVNPGSLRTDYPHAGILNTTKFLWRYPTTATNRNRARSRWTYYHFLGLDIEKSASRTIDPEALADTNNPTLYNPACTVCHRVLDPVAGAFQNYGETGLYKDGGMDSLDEFYKHEAGTALAIRADSRQERETLSWTLPLGVGDQTLKVLFTNDFHDQSTGADRNVHLDRLSVRDAGGRVLVRQEFEAIEPLTASFGDCGERSHDHLFLWTGGHQCAVFVDVQIPATDVYHVDVVAWSDGPAVNMEDGEDGFPLISVAVNAYQQGDTWYRDMRVPGFAGERAPNSDNSVQWLARKIVADERFAEATVKFWWPAIMGSEVAEPPEDKSDADFEGRLLAANAQAAEVARLARGFRQGFKWPLEARRRSEYNLKDLLAEIVLSKWFRADAVTDADPVRRIALRDAGARRLLTPEELARKTASLTGVQWGRFIPTGCLLLRSNRCARPRGESFLDIEYRILYGGIDSVGITKRARGVNSVMAAVAKRYAAMVSCPAVVRELYLLPEGSRRLFSGIDKHVTEPGAIKSKLVELHEALLGVQVTPYSPDVEAAYQLFLDVRERGREAREDLQFWQCDIGSFGDMWYFEGILPDALTTWIQDGYLPAHVFDWDRVDPFLDGIDWSDPHHAAQAWIVVLAYLMTDYRYLYL